MFSRPLIVIGMHRSGTSALSGELSRFGVFMGRKLFKAQAGVNEKGFWENSQVVKLNDLILDGLKSSWDNPVHLNIEQQNSCSDFVELGQALIKQEYANKLLWGMKDPRTTILLPFWQNVFSKSHINPIYVLIVRNPLEVAESLRKRDGFSRDKSLMLWLNYNFMAIEYSQPENRLIFSFSEVVNQPEIILNTLKKEFDLPFQSQTSQSFIDKRLKTNNTEFSLEEGDFLYCLSQKVYLALLQFDAPQLEQLKVDYKQYIEQLNPVLLEHLIQIQESESHYRQLFEQAYNSFYWKLFRPFKKVEEGIRKLLATQQK
ncbi:sulfotransferase family protein [Thalassotalea aquiviva]|uniref:sulfotransferase family protein n=1 Tax=Thalassotalea aquiviva TaxID=3242415 RepID=UPI00352BD037